jgi:hypothetical protein
VVAGAAFALGFAAGLMWRGRGWRLSDGFGWQSHGAEGTVTYDENLPDTLGRREPLPDAGQPRFGGTGALGVHPAAADRHPGQAPPNDGKL